LRLGGDGGKAAFRQHAIMQHSTIGGFGVVAGEAREGPADDRVAGSHVIAAEQGQEFDGRFAAKQRQNQRLLKADGAIPRPGVAPALEVMRLGQVPLR
jgi:hypothetical protein